MNISARALTQRVKGYGFALRGFATKRPSVTETDLFRRMWAAGLSRADIARAHSVSARTVDNTRDRLKLPGRRPGSKPECTLDQFYEERAMNALRDAMLATARAERVQFVLAEMVDCTRAQRRKTGDQNG